MRNDASQEIDGSLRLTCGIYTPRGKQGKQFSLDLSKTVQSPGGIPDPRSSTNRSHLWHELILPLLTLISFKTALVLSEQPPLVDDELERWWKMWGGEPDLNGKDLEEVAKQILSRNRKYDS